MEITKELLQKKADATKANMDGFLQGYFACLNEFAKEIEAQADPINQTNVKPAESK